MTSNITRIPLAIALSSALAFAVGCSGERNADERAGVTNDPAAQTAPAATTAGDVRNDPAMGDANPDGLGDGRDSAQPVDDTWITTKVKSSLLAESDVSGLDINVDTLNGVVTLQGQVENQAQIDTATRVARGIEGVTDVQTSGLTVGPAN
ncbi:BON domain-containing protein [Luteimonas yindakuii]|uniref:BON domain-containing protein n=1 Tax=Luteimonas yindakuii TaxID=2565782 RepID=UPI0010A478B4|nr:BON domain-containing protein [Luteimonas yindakuii]QCO68440.1 BON domain-containing protein [Luteimonas yindakuii]